MAKKTVSQPRVTKRTAIPHGSKDKNGNIIFLCPFCKPPHPLIPGKISSCGTQLQLEAVQVVYHAKYSNLVCAKCGKTGGDMTKWLDAFVHIEDCTPGVQLLNEEPEYSHLAAVIYKLPVWARIKIEKFTGQVMTVDEVQPDGKRTGKVLGCFFMKGRKK